MAKSKPKPPKRNWSITRPSNAVVDIRVDGFRRRDDWEFWCLLTTDRHWDNPHSDWEMQRRHLDEAVRIDAPVIDNGDFFCAMQGKYDRRASKSCVRPEHQKDNYLDTLVDTAADFFEPYANNIAIIGDGNHETAIKKNHETDLIERFVGVVNRKTGSNIHHCGYGSWVRFLFTDGNSNLGVSLKRFHGHGGGGPVTRGVIGSNRRAASIDADIIFTGHVHEEWNVTTVRESLSQAGSVRHKRQLHICGATYKEEYQDGTEGWHVETGKPPKPVGAVWLRFKYKSLRKQNSGQMIYDAIQAQ